MREKFLRTALQEEWWRDLPHSPHCPIRLASELGAMRSEAAGPNDALRYGEAAPWELGGAAMGNIGALTEAIGAELRHAIRESQYSAGRNPDSYGAGFDAGWVEALRWVLKQADTTQSTRAA